MLHEEGRPQRGSEIGDGLPDGEQLGALVGRVLARRLVIAQRHLRPHVPLPQVSVEGAPRNGGQPGAGIAAAIGGDPGASAQIRLLEEVVGQVEVAPQPDEQPPHRLPVGLPHPLESVEP